MVRALTLLYDATAGDAWSNHSNWLAGEPCIDGWFGVHCCPELLPILQGDTCTSVSGELTTAPSTQGSAACHSGSATGTAADHATCVVVKVMLPSNNLIGPLDALDPEASERALCGLAYLQHLDLSGNSRQRALEPCLRIAR